MPLKLQLVCLIAALCAAAPAGADTPRYPLTSKSAAIIVRYVYRAAVPADAVSDPKAPLDIWLPLPSNDPWQTVTGINVEAPAQVRIGFEKTYGDKMAYVHLARPVYPAVVTATFTVTRREPRVLAGSAGVNRETLPADISPDQLTPVGGAFLSGATGIVGSDRDAIDRERDLFRNVVASVSYDYKKISPRYAMGDSEFVCRFRCGNCTDFHSYLISLSRSLSIPAVSEFGFPLTGIEVPDPIPVDGTVSGYHCWVWFKAGDRWIPEDASDARRWQDIGRHDVAGYLFGNLLLARCAVAISRGRDLVLAPPQKGPALNYFVYPYAEAGGRPTPVEWSVAYHLIN